MADIRTPEGVIVRVTGRSPELFLRIITPVAKEIAGLTSEGEPVSLSDGRKRRSAAQGH